MLKDDVHAAKVLLRAAWRAAMAYRASFLTTLIGGIAFQGTQLLFIGVLLSKFGAIGGWRLNDVAFLFAIRLAAHAFYVVPFGALLSFDRAIQQGDVDRYLLRPAAVYLQVVTRYAPLMALGDALLGFSALAAFAGPSSVEWDPPKVAYLLGCVVSGGLIEAGVQTFLAGLSFRLRSSESLRILADDTLTRFSGYPLTIFGRRGLAVLTFVFPMAFIAYLPATVLLGRTDELPFPDWIAVLSPCAGPIVFGIGLTFFNRMTRYYTSPGS